MCLTAFLNSQNTDLAAEIGKNLYVDNIMMTADTAEEALQKYRDSKILFAKIGMNLREYISNSNEVNSQIPIRDSLENGPLKFLGVNYNTILDNFKVMTHFRPVSQIAKKEIVNQINSVYDPIGLAAPLLVRLKAIMREVFEHKDLEWTDVLDLPICERWNKLCENVNNAVISVPRSISQQGSKMRLWVFADASNVAIATCAYLLCTFTGTVSTLISGKTKLSPKRCRQTIPRLELVGILMAIRLGNSVISNMCGHIGQISIESQIVK
ncbi:hypothetical protein RB195_006229 [Necator americanus]|uniref:Reverse transcriptase domain-containing protein n=1 Tax=Necator americanus TaxID=51031 RepID=A0ABR1BUG5_NECAM